MADHWDFERFLELAESYGYKFIGFWNPYRVFINADEPDELPWLIPVYRGKIDIEYIEKFKRWLKRKGLLKDENEDEDETNGPEAVA